MAILVKVLVAKAIPTKSPSSISTKLPSFDTMTKAKQHYCSRFGGLLEVSKYTGSRIPRIFSFVSFRGVVIKLRI